MKNQYLIISALIAILLISCGENKIIKSKDITINTIIVTQSTNTQNHEKTATSIISNDTPTLKYMPVPTEIEIMQTIFDRGSLVNTYWEGSGSDGDTFSLAFYSENRIRYISFRDLDIYKGFWRQYGKNVFFNLNDEFCNYQGIIDGNNIRGKASNKDGGNWEWNVEYSSQIG